VTYRVSNPSSTQVSTPTVGTASSPIPTNPMRHKTSTARFSKPTKMAIFSFFWYVSKLQDELISANKYKKGLKNLLFTYKTQKSFSASMTTTITATVHLGGLFNELIVYADKIPNSNTLVIVATFSLVLVWATIETMRSGSGTPHVARVCTQTTPRSMSLSASQKAPSQLNKKGGYKIRVKDMYSERVEANTLNLQRTHSKA